MKKSAGAFGVGKSASIFVVAAMFLGIGLAQARDKHSVIPSKILSARTIYIDNETPEADLQYNAVMGVNKWGRYEIVGAPQKADIVLRLVGSGTVKFVPASEAPTIYNPKPVNASFAEGEELAPPGCTRVEVLDAKSGSVLWSETRKTGNPQEKSRLVEGLHDAVDQQEKSHK